MPRHPKSRRICIPPKMKGFKPFGISFCKEEPVQLTFEEYESMRLVNYELLDQDVAASQMNISRPTFTRIYNKALRQIALSFIEGRTIEIDGGCYQLDKDWYRCRKCFRLIEGSENHVKCKGCASFGENELINLNCKQKNF